jgi:hypothetical protein
MPAASKGRNTSVTSHSKRGDRRVCANDRYRPKRSALLDPLLSFRLAPQKSAVQRLLSLGSVRRVHGVGNIAVIEVAGSTSRG